MFHRAVKWNLIHWELFNFSLRQTSDIFFRFPETSGRELIFIVLFSIFLYLELYYLQYIFLVSWLFGCGILSEVLWIEVLIFSIVGSWIFVGILRSCIVLSFYLKNLDFSFDESWFFIWRILILCLMNLHFWFDIIFWQFLPFLRKFNSQFNIDLIRPSHDLYQFSFSFSGVKYDIF